MDEQQIQQEDDILITNDVARAIEEDELLAYYQPLVSLEDGKVVGAEALVRWTMPDGTIVPAGLFVPSLERTDTIYGLDWYMAEDVCSFLEQHADTPARVPVSLNFSPLHAPREADFGRKVVDTGSWHGVGTDELWAELSESVVLRGGPAVDAMVASIVASGVTMVVDNVVTGVEGLQVFVQRGIHRIKIAAAWWRGRPVAELQELTQAAAELGVDLSAEGVENAEEVELLRQGGFVCAQGYHLGRPMDGAAFAQLCAQA